MKHCGKENTVIVRIEGSNRKSIFQVYQNVYLHNLEYGTLCVLHTPMESLLDYITDDDCDSIDIQCAKYEVGRNDAITFEENHHGDVIYTIFRDYPIEED